MSRKTLRIVALLVAAAALPIGMARAENGVTADKIVFGQPAENRLRGDRALEPARARPD